MAIRYKLLTQDLRTLLGEDNETQWILGEWVEAKGTGGLCTDGVIHLYSSPEVAAFLNPVHADIDNPVFAELEVSEIVEETPTKGGARRARITRLIPAITPTVTQRVAFGIFCAKSVCKEKAFNAWADKWLSGEDRSHTTARAAAWASANAAAWAAANAAAWASAAAAANAAEKTAEVAAAEAGIDLTAIAKQALEQY